jgi:hypothetical protein
VGEVISAAEYRARNAPKSTGKGKTNAKPADAAQRKPATKSDHSDELTNPKMQAARAEVAKLGRYAGVYTGFGLTQSYRKYVLLDEEQAVALDKAFYEITGAKPA